MIGRERNVAGYCRWGAAWRLTASSQRGQKSGHLARGSAVNDDQMDGFAVPDAVESLGPDHPAADAFVTGTGAKVEHGGERAYYRSSTDYIQMPNEGLFAGTATKTGTGGHYVTLVHELVP